MSLASRLVNTLFPSQSNNLVTTEGNSTNLTLCDGGLDGKAKIAPPNTIPRKELPSMEEKEMEERPPYLHVWYNGHVSHTMTNRDKGNTCWRYRRNIGRYAHAFSGHRKDPSTGRSSYASQIHGHVLDLLHDLSPGRLCSRPVQWSYASPVRVFPRHCDLFWNP